MLSAISLMIGILCILFILAGFIIPSGKIIIIEALAVIQITYFSILHYEKIPTSYIGFKNLIFSSGFNMISSTSSDNRQILNVFQLLGFNMNMALNYNISFIILFCLPLCIVVGGYAILKIFYQNK